MFKMLKKLMSYTYRNKMNIKRKKKCDINTLLFFKQGKDNNAYNKKNQLCQLEVQK